MNMGGPNNLSEVDELGFEDYRVDKAPNQHPLFIVCLKNLYKNME